MESPEWRTPVGSIAIRANTPPGMSPYPIQSLGPIVIYGGPGGSQYKVTQETHMPMYVPPWAHVQVHVQRRSIGAEGPVCAPSVCTGLESLGCIVYVPDAIKPANVAIPGGACDEKRSRGAKVNIYSGYATYAT